MNTFPGVKIQEDTAKIMSKILVRLNPENIAPIENMKKWLRIDNEVYGSEILVNYDEFYLFYKHPVHDYLDKLFLTKREELVSFMKDRIIPDREEGMDLLIAPKDFTKLIVCNHDGEIYLVI